MPDPLAHVYDLARDALAEQERQVAELRGRLTPVLAASGLAATLLTPLAFRDPAGSLTTACGVVGLVGIVVVLLSALYVLAPRSLSFGWNASRALDAVGKRGVADVSVFYAQAIVGLDGRSIENLRVILRLHTAVTLMLCGMLLEVCGLAVAATIS